MKKRIYIFINGIMCRPGDAQNWNSRAVDWINVNTDDRAVMVEYFCTPIGRAFFQKNRAEKLANKIEQYQGWEIILVGHSNGTDLILNALQLMDEPKIAVVHLVSAACQADFEANGLNAALLARSIGKVNVWRGGADSALHIAKCWLGRLLGYGTLGLTGPVNGESSKEFWTDKVWTSRDHSDCWKDYCFTETMRGFLL